MITWGPDTKCLQNWSLSQPILPVSSPAEVLSKTEGNLEGVGRENNEAEVLVTTLVLTAVSMSEAIIFPVIFLLSIVSGILTRKFKVSCAWTCPSWHPFLILCSWFIFSCLVCCYKIVDTIPSMENCLAWLELPYSRCYTHLPKLRGNPHSQWLPDLVS